MPGFFREHLRPLAGAALRWTSSQPPVEIAIEGYVVEDSPPARVPAASRRAEPEVAPPSRVEPTPPELATNAAEQRRAEEAASAQRAAQAERERRELEHRAETERSAQREQAAAQQRRSDEAAAESRRAEQADAERRRAAESEAKRKAADEEAKRKAAAAEAQRMADEQAQAERDASLRAEREAALQRRLAAEEEGASVASAGVLDEYRRLLSQTIERNWIRPPSARAGLECTLYVTQAPGGVVTDVKLGTCNGDAAVRESIANAVYKASPLPAPRDPRAFERRLEIVFKPTE
jgi:colicin import membrane protein